MVYRMYCLNSLWMVYMIHEIYDLVLMMPQYGMIMLIYVLYDDSYESFYLSFIGFHLGFYVDDYVATRALWTGPWRSRIWA